MLHELRIYHIHPGKMEAIHRRFRDHTLSLFAKHGMTVVDFWQDTASDSLYYLMEHKDMESRDEGFDAFRQDPEWIRVRDESEADGPIVREVQSVFLTRVPYAPSRGR